VPLIVVRAALQLTGLHGQQRLCPIPPAPSPPAPVQSSLRSLPTCSMFVRIGAFSPNR
jgi:hypothetical protein